MSEKKKQEYTTGGLKNRQDVENALASAEYRPSQEVTDAASDLKQWQANRPGDYESAYQGRIDGLMEDLLDRKEFSYSYGADPLYRQYAQLYTQNAQNASADAAAQAAALTGGYGSSYAASAALWLKSSLGCGRLVVFGDGENDVDLFEAADEAYAVANAADVLKAVATGVIGANDEDGVARWLDAHARCAAQTQGGV